jgi:hypothetical protein
MKYRTTPLGAMLRMTALAAAAPETMSPSATVDRRLMSPADMSGHGHSPAQMANPARGLTLMAADVQGSGAHGKIDATTGHLSADIAALTQEASIGVATTHLLS